MSDAAEIMFANIANTQRAWQWGAEKRLAARREEGDSIAQGISTLAEIPTMIRKKQESDEAAQLDHAFSSEMLRTGDPMGAADAMLSVPVRYATGAAKQTQMALKKAEFQHRTLQMQDEAAIRLHRDVDWRNAQKDRMAKEAEEAAFSGHFAPRPTAGTWSGPGEPGMAAPGPVDMLPGAPSRMGPMQSPWSLPDVPGMGPSAPPTLEEAAPGIMSDPVIQLPTKMAFADKVRRAKTDAALERYHAAEASAAETRAGAEKLRAGKPPKAPNQSYAESPISAEEAQAFGFPELAGKPHGILNEFLAAKKAPKPSVHEDNQHVITQDEAAQLGSPKYAGMTVGMLKLKHTLTGASKSGTPVVADREELVSIRSKRAEFHRELLALSPSKRAKSGLQEKIDTLDERESAILKSIRGSGAVEPAAAPGDEAAPEVADDEDPVDAELRKRAEGK